MKLANSIPILKNNIKIREAKTEKVINIIIREIEKSIETLSLKLNTDSVLKYLRYLSVRSDLSSKKIK
ncbi:MAG: hypothetical protein KAV48_04715 [Methanomicrobia archaeon]|nr:hypothetical protein [Methanomicrobia archaeon]